MRQSLDVDLEENLCKSETEAEDLNDAADSQDLDQDTAQQSARRPQTTNKPHLHGLRGLAALVVYIGHHVAWWYGPGGPLEHGFGYHGEKMFGTFPFIRTAFTGGSASVHIFFILSGYVLSVSPVRMLHEKQELRSIYRDLLSAFLRRPFRLYIPLAGVSITLALVMHLPYSLAPHLDWPEPEPTIWSELAKWSREFIMMMNPFKKHGVDQPWFPYDPPAWTMPAEYKGSIAVFTLLGVFGLTPPLYHIYLFGLTGLVMLMIHDWVVACFMFGVVLAIADLESDGVNQKPLFNRLPQTIRTIMNSMVFFLAWWIIGQPTDPDPEFSYATPGWYYLTKIIPRNYYNYENWRFWNSIGATMMVYSICNLAWLKSFFSWRCMQFLGKISFLLYLVHTPILWTAGDTVCRLLGLVRQDFATWYDGKLTIPDVGPQGISTGFLASQLIIFPLNVLIALCAWRVLDQPGVNIGHWIVARLGLSRAARNVTLEGRENSEAMVYMPLHDLEQPAEDVGLRVPGAPGPRRDSDESNRSEVSTATTLTAPDWRAP